MEKKTMKQSDSRALSLDQQIQIGNQITKLESAQSLTSSERKTLSELKAKLQASRDLLEEQNQRTLHELDGRVADKEKMQKEQERLAQKATEARARSIAEDQRRRSEQAQQEEERRQNEQQRLARLERLSKLQFGPEHGKIISAQFIPQIFGWAVHFVMDNGIWSHGTGKTKAEAIIDAKGRIIEGDYDHRDYEDYQAQSRHEELLRAQRDAAAAADRLAREAIATREEEKARHDELLEAQRAAEEAEQRRAEERAEREREREEARQRRHDELLEAQRDAEEREEREREEREEERRQRREDSDHGSDGHNDNDSDNESDSGGDENGEFRVINIDSRHGTFGRTGHGLFGEPRKKAFALEHDLIVKVETANGDWSFGFSRNGRRDEAVREAIDAIKDGDPITSYVEDGEIQYEL